MKCFKGLRIDKSDEYEPLSSQPRYVLLRYPKFVTRVRSSNFDRCHSFLLALSAAGSARKRPHFESLWYDAPVCIIIMELDEKWLGVAESTSHSQLESRGACSPDAELANPRRRRDNSPWCILYIFNFEFLTDNYLSANIHGVAAFGYNAIHYITNTSKLQ